MSIAPSSASAAITPFLAVASVAAIVSDVTVVAPVSAVEPLFVTAVLVVANVMSPMAHVAPGAVAPMPATRVMLVHCGVPWVEAEEEQVANRGDVVCGNAAEFVLEARFELVVCLRGSRRPEHRDGCCGHSRATIATCCVRVMGIRLGHELPAH